MSVSDQSPSSNAPSEDIVVKPFAPVVTIVAPTKGTIIPSWYGSPAIFAFAGGAHDPQDGLIPGTRLRWTAKPENASGNDPVTVVCQGSGWPRSGAHDDTLVSEKSCSLGVGAPSPESIPMAPVYAGY